MKKYLFNTPFVLENKNQLFGVEVAYSTYGHFIPGKTKVVWVCHALTANSNVDQWWSGLFGDGLLLDPHNSFVVCANILGSCYGTTGPMHIDPFNGAPYYLRFPEITIRDMVKLHIALANVLGIDKIDVLVGGSIGGQQALEWAIEEPERIKQLILLATNAQHSAWGKAFNETQRMALLSDPTFLQCATDGGRSGLKTARAIALLSYRNYKAYAATEDASAQKTAQGYQNYQGEKFVNRFNAYSYWYLSKAMDTHDVGRNRGGVSNALKRITAPTCVIGIFNDQLFPPEEQHFLAKHIRKSRIEIIHSLYGHDGFLIETKQIQRAVAAFQADYTPKRKFDYTYY
jgi:homoserine O-acetyltransferase/O-succinyltransferase